MKRLSLLFIIFYLFISSVAAQSDTLMVRINGMRCAECGHKVKNVLRKNPGVGALEFNYERRTAKIAYDAQKTCPDTIYSMLARTGRYAAKPFNPKERIGRGIGQRIADMHCQKCADRIIASLSKLDGVDSLASHLDKSYMFIRYDANRVSRDDIRQVINNLGYTPCNYYSSPKVEYGYYLLPAEQANEETAENVLSLDGVEDVNINPKRRSLAVTFFNDETTADKLYVEIKKMGIKAEVPGPHECDEK